MPPCLSDRTIWAFPLSCSGLHMAGKDVSFLPPGGGESAGSGLRKGARVRVPPLVQQRLTELLLWAGEQTSQVPATHWRP